MSLRLQRTSSAPELYTSTRLTRPYTRSTPPELHTSFEATPAANRQSSMPPRLHDCSVSLYLHFSSPLHLQRTSRHLLRQRPKANSMPPELQISIPLCLPSAHLQTSTRPRLHACSAPPELRSSIPLRGITPAAHLPTSIPLYRHTCSTPPELLRQGGNTPAAHLQSS